MPEPPRPGCRSSAGRPNNPAARPRSSRSQRNYRRAPAGDTAQDWPVPPVRFGIRWTPRDFGKVVGDVGNRRHERPGDPHDPLADRMGVPQGVSTRGETNPGRTARCIKYWGVEIIIWGHSLLGGQGCPPGPSPRSTPRVFDIEVNTTVQQPIRNIDHELRSSLASLQPALAVPGNRDERGGDVRGADASPFSSDEESTNDPAGRYFDEALEQIASEGCCECPLCGAIVASDGSVVS